MDIGRVLLRDAHYVWRERVAILEKDNVVLQSPSSAWQAAAAVTRSSKKIKLKLKLKSKLTKQRSRSKAPPPSELLPLDGSLNCEGIVVSSAHMHSVRLQDLRSGHEFLVDATTKGKKQMWIDLFTSAQNRANINASGRRDLSLMNIEHTGEMVRSLTLLDMQQAVEMLLAATESDTAMSVVRGYDVEDILLGNGSAVDFTESEASMLAKKLVEDDVLLPFCCSCSFVYRVNDDHRLVKDALGMSVDSEQKSAEEGPLDGRRHCRGHLLWLHDSAFQELLAFFDRLLCVDHEEGISGTDCVRALLQFGAYSVPTAIALANALLHHEFLVQCFSSDDSNSGVSFRMNTAARYKKVCTESTNVVADYDKDVKRRVIVSSERAGRSMDDRCQLEAKVKKLKENYLRLYNLFCFCFCCVMMLLDALVTTVLLPGALKLSFVTGLLLWLTLSGGSATLSFNFQPRNPEEEFDRISQEIDERRQKVFSQMYSTPRSKLVKSQKVPLSSTTTITERRGSAAVKVMQEETMDRTVIALARVEKAEVHSFRLAIAQAATVPVKAIHVFSDEYLFSVLRVKNRAFAYAVTKMARIIQWRRTYEVDSIGWDDVKSQLGSGNMYWYGYDFQNRPILWVRAKLKDWTTMSSRREVEVRAHVYLLELGCRYLMPPGVTTYTIVTDSTGLGMAQIDLRLMRMLLDVCVANFPDRIGLVHAGPLTWVLKYVASWLWPFLPGRLRGKVSLMHDCVAELAKHMNTELIPLHLGGTVMHNLRTPSTSPTEGEDIMEITYMIDQQKRFMEELQIQQ